MGAPTRLDAIVVSSARPAGNTRPALDLGAMLGVPVLLMCSHDTRSDDAADNASRSGADCVVIDLTEDPERGLPAFATSAFAEAIAGSHGDLSHKRNLALTLGKLCGWRRLLFLDDDIRDLDAGQVRRATAALEHRAAVGMLAIEFPDNSVVCHAHRASGGEQGVFVSGSALAVNLRRADTFFPQIYNEDWLFLAPHLDRREVAAVGEVRQLEYRPFANPGRAETQEFGDVLAEGLIGYLHSARLYPPPDIEYWETFLDERATFIATSRKGCVAAAANDAVSALDIAEDAWSRISAPTLADYVAAWVDDLAMWRQFVVGLPRVADLAAAIDYLGHSAEYVTSNSIPSLPRSGQHPDSALRDPDWYRRLCSE